MIANIRQLLTAGIFQPFAISAHAGKQHWAVGPDRVGFKPGGAIMGAWCAAEIVPFDDASTSVPAF